MRCHVPSNLSMSRTSFWEIVQNQLNGTYFSSLLKRLLGKLGISYLVKLLSNLPQPWNKSQSSILQLEEQIIASSNGNKNKEMERDKAEAIFHTNPIMLPVSHFKFILHGAIKDMMYTVTYSHARFVWETLYI